MSKVWFITGAGSGIGAGTAKAALKAGDRVVATGRNVEKVRNALKDASGNLEVLQLDFPDEAQAKAAIDQAVKEFGRVDVVVNNTGYSNEAQSRPEHGVGLLRECSLMQRIHERPQ